jgi:glutathione S-transferase
MKLYWSPRSPFARKVMVFAQRSSARLTVTVVE